MKIHRLLLLAVLLVAAADLMAADKPLATSGAPAATTASPPALAAETVTSPARSVTQYGITWTFDKPYPVGKFVTGDWWVVGPVTVVSVTPSAGPAPGGEAATSGKSRYGAAALKDDKRMRNGSMIILGPDPTSGFGKEGYDSRIVNYSPELSVVFPCQLAANRSLISSISSENYQKNKHGDLELATPFVLNFKNSKLGGLELAPCYAPGSDKPQSTLQTPLVTEAVLTCLDKAPPADAFRPPYVGTEKPIYETKDIHWALLPKLKPPASTPDWAVMERVFQRPWFDHVDNWLAQYTSPGENEPNYGREWSRVTAMGSLMLMLDVPREQKEKLMIEYIQLGLDLRGLAGVGKQWFADGGHFTGRKWPILFAGLMLDKPELRTFPPADIKKRIYGALVEPSPEVPAPTTFFQEDLQTYFGKGALGQKALWQVVEHTGCHPPYEEKPWSDWNAEDKFVSNYRHVNSMAWVGTALAAELMKAKALWGHDAFFDYVDRWMRPEETLFDKDGKSVPIPTWVRGVTRCQELFVEDLWKAYRQNVPAQPGAAHNYKWVWTDVKKGVGHWETNNPQ